MMSYFKNSDLSIRLGLNPVNWKWIPAVSYEGPTPFYPKRRTFALIILFLQVFLDVDDGTTDMTGFNKLFHQTMDAYDESEVGSKVSRVNKTNLDLE